MRLGFAVPPEEAGMKLGAFLRRQGVSLAVVRSQKFVPGGIVVNGQPARTSLVLRAGDEVALMLPEECGFSAMPQPLPLEVVYEDAHAMVLNKPAGQVVHPDASHRQGTLANAFCGMMEQRSGGGVFRPVGRLDGDTSGLVACAMHAAAAHPMMKSMQKEYLALAGGCMPPGEGVVDAPIAPVEGSAIAQQVAVHGRASRTLYRVEASCSTASLVRVWPQTGRTHQIRVHLAHLGHPLLGDSLYGGNMSLMGRHALHCCRVSFDAFDGHVELQRGLPEDMDAAAHEMGLAEAPACEKGHIWL